MKKILFTLSIFFTLIISTKAVAQNAAEFCLTINPAGTNYCLGVSLLQASDGSFIVAGTRCTFVPDVDFYMCKISDSGTLLWTKELGTPGISDYLFASCNADGGNFMLAGAVVISGGFSLYLIKTDSSGTILSSNAYQYLGGDVELNSIIKTSDNGYAVTGIISYAGPPDFIFAARFDSSMNQLWSVESINEGHGNSIFQTNDGGFAIAGYNTDVRVIKLDSLGNVEWSKKIGGSMGEQGNAVIQTDNGDFIISGLTSSVSGTHFNIYLVKLDSSGNLLWTKPFGSPTYEDGGYTLTKTYDGGYAVTGYYLSRAFVMKFDENDSLQWTTMTSGFSGVSFDARIIETNDHGLAVATLDVFTHTVSLFKIDSMGNGCCTIPVILPTDSVGISSNGGTMSFLSSPSVSTIGTVTASNFSSSLVCSSTGISLHNQTMNEIIISPNPSSGNFTINFSHTINKGELKLYNPLTENLFTEKINNESKKEINLINLSDGVYFVKVSDGEKSYCKKLIVE